MILSRAFLLTNVSVSDLVERERGRLPVRATWATKMRTASGSEVPSVLVTFAARLSNFGSTRQRKSTVMLQMCHLGNGDASLSRQPGLIWRYRIGTGKVVVAADGKSRKVTETDMLNGKELKSVAVYDKE